jgi:hypothetical protein
MPSPLYAAGILPFFARLCRSLCLFRAVHVSHVFIPSIGAYFPHWMHSPADSLKAFLAFADSRT